jgi:ppGpp synthetase/RelA/SpoT-type nucleotidyltranferase
MAMEVEPDSVDEKNDFLNRQDMAIGSIDMSVSPKIFHQIYEESQGLTPNELCTRLEVLFGNKEYCEDFMQEVEQIETEEKPSEDQASYSEESSTKVFCRNLYSIN